MTRITTTILIFMILMNGSVTVMEGSGLSEDLGVQLAPGISDRMNGVIDTMKGGFQPDTSVVESLVSVLVAAGSLFLVVIQGLYAAPTMFLNLGFPAWIVIPFFAPAYLISTMELVFLLSGRDMI